MGVHKNKASEDSHEERFVTIVKQKEGEKTVILPLHDDQDDFQDTIRMAKTTHSNALSFPRKLHTLLEQAEKDDLSHIISWQPNGKSFTVRKPEMLDEALCRYIGISRLTSFYRLLSLHGFQKITNGIDKGAYYHEKFLRGKGFLASKITSVHGKRASPRQNSLSSDAKPDFWKIPLSDLDDASQSSDEDQVESKNHESTDILETSTTDGSQSERPTTTNPLGEKNQKNDDLNDESQAVEWGRRYYTVDCVMNDPTWNSLLHADWDETPLA